MDGPLWWIIGGALVAVAFFVVLMFVVVPAITMRVLARTLQRRVDAFLPEREVLRRDLRALTLGLESAGQNQLRGNGALVLTSETLWWFLAVPRREIQVPLASVETVGTTRKHLGKGYGRDLLHVGFRSPDGDVHDGLDELAWLVDDLDGWLADLRRETGTG